LSTSLKYVLGESTARVCKATPDAFTSASVVECSMNVKEVGAECHSNMTVVRYATQDDQQHILAIHKSHAIQRENLCNPLIKTQNHLISVLCLFLYPLILTMKLYKISMSD
jgi:hypothetical protein